MKRLINTKKFSPGFTLIELVVSIVVISIAFTLILVSFSPANRDSANPVIQVRAAELGQAYLEEIIGKRFDENGATGSWTRCGEAGQPACSATLGPEAGETRATYDDVDDYNDQDGVAEVPADALGNTRTEYSNYRVLITVAYAGGDLSLNANDAKRIDVTITSPTGDQYDFTTYKTNF